MPVSPISVFKLLTVSGTLTPPLSGSSTQALRGIVEPFLNVFG